MAAVASMGEVDEVNSKGEVEVITNGEITKNVDEEHIEVKTKPIQKPCDEPMEVEDIAIEDTKDDEVDCEDKEQGDELESEDEVDHDKDDEVDEEEADMESEVEEIEVEKEGDTFTDSEVEEVEVDKEGEASTSISIEDEVDEICEADKEDEVVEADSEDEIVQADKDDEIVEVIEADKEDEVVEADKEDEVVETDSEDEVDEIGEADKEHEVVEADNEDDVVEADKEDEVIEAGEEDEVVEAGKEDEVVEADKEEEVVGANKEDEVGNADEDHDVGDVDKDEVGDADKDVEVGDAEDPLSLAPDINKDSDSAKEKTSKETVDAANNEQDDISSDKCEKLSDKEHKSEKNKSESTGNNKQCTEDRDIIEIHEILDDDDEEEELQKNNKQNGISKSKHHSASETIELNDSGDTDGEGDVMIVEETTTKPNGPTEKRKSHAELEIIDLDKPAKKPKIEKMSSVTPRRSTRNINRQKSYAESDKEEEEEDAKNLKSESEESDIEEVLPEDPLAVMDAVSIEKVNHKVGIKPSSNSSTIVVKDTKKLVEIASKSNSSTMTSGKKEPTLVIIDTNSILSGRGPIPVTTKPPQPASKITIPKSLSTIKPSLSSMKPTLSALKSSLTSIKPQSSQQSPVNISHHPPYPTLLPMALPAQGMYPANMRATITPIPVSVPHPAPIIQKQAPPPPPPPLLPTLTDDMFVVEAPSFIVPYVYEKPPRKEFKGFVKDMEKEIAEQKKKKEEAKKEEEARKEKKATEADKKDPDGEKEEGGEENGESSKDKEKDDSGKNEKSDDNVKIEESSKAESDKPSDTKKPYSYFESPLGKFFIDIGMGLVQEFVQTDLLKQQKRKRDREGGQNSETNKTIQSLLKNLEYSKENNSAFKMAVKKCEFCHFKTESALALANHLETPHMKNYVYKCNFCTYEVRSPHDILFHMEAEHAVKGRLERAPSFHQCSNCPFEDNQKGKLSRHLVACTRKFKPDRNLEPPIDWEPPAKIPRVPKMRQAGQGLNAAAIQGMSKTYQFLSKMQLQNANVLNRGRGRPTLGAPIKQPVIRPTTAGMVYKQTMSGGSVLVPANYHLGGNQVFQVLGGTELGGRLGHPGHMAFLPNMSSASSTFSSMQQQQQQQQQSQQTQQQNQTQKKHQPSISITPLPRASTSTTVTPVSSKPGDTNAKNSFVICEICDGYIKDLEQLRNHMQWIHKIKIHPKMIYNRPPLNCQKCQFRFFTDQGLERHLLGSHGLVTSSMQDAANKSKDAGRCPVCGRVYQWKLLNHVARDHNMTLKPAHLSYKCTVCTATFGMYKQFENHVYSAHSVVAKRVMDKKGSSNSSSSTSTTSNNKNDMMKPLKINDEITIIPQPNKSSGVSTSKEGSPSSTGSSSSRTGTPSTSKNAETEPSTTSRAERVTRRTTNGTDD